MKKIFTILGTSGVGKTMLSNRLASSRCYHYSIDFEIINNHIGSIISTDIIERVKSESPFFASLLASNKIDCNLTPIFNDLYLASFFMQCGVDNNIPTKSFLERQKIYRDAEIIATSQFALKAEKCFASCSYDYFLNDCAGSFCEIVNIESNDQIINNIRDHTNVLYIETTEDSVRTLIERAKVSPKPLLYDEKFLSDNIVKHNMELNITKDFLSHIFPELVSYRREKYKIIAQKTNAKVVTIEQAAEIKDIQDLIRIFV